MQNFFAKNIKYFRQKKNIDQSVMAEDLGVAQSTLSCWENGLRTPDLDMVAKIAKYLNVYDDFISKDLTDIDNIQKFDELELLFDKHIIKTIIEERKKEIDKELGEND